MFERYTEKARRVIFFARYEASQFGSPYIETEHLLLGLLREDKALTNRFLRSHASVESIRKQIETHTTIREKVSTSVDLPRIQVVFLENAHAGGPGGAKGIGELPMDGPAPAVVNALENALGVLRLDEVPMTPDRLLERCEEVSHG